MLRTGGPNRTLTSIAIRQRFDAKFIPGDQSRYAAMAVSALEMKSTDSVVPCGGASLDATLARLPLSWRSRYRICMQKWWFWDCSILILPQIEESPVARARWLPGEDHLQCELDGERTGDRFRHLLTRLGLLA